jgi:hypothetical protein
MKMTSMSKAGRYLLSYTARSRSSSCSYSETSLNLARTMSAQDILLGVEPSGSGSGTGVCGVV